MSGGESGGQFVSGGGSGGQFVSGGEVVSGATSEEVEGAVGGCAVGGSVVGGLASMRRDISEC